MPADDAWPHRESGPVVRPYAVTGGRTEPGGGDTLTLLTMLVATGQVRPEQLENCATVGELALDGSIRPIKGALSMAMEAKARKVSRILVPAANAREAAVVEGVNVYGVGALGEAVGLITGELTAEPLTAVAEDAFERLRVAGYR